jgi:hypothetical protein
MIAFDRGLHDTRWYCKPHYTYTILIRSRPCSLSCFISVKADDITATGGRNGAVKVSRWVSKHWTGDLKLSTSSVGVIWWHLVLTDGSSAFHVMKLFKILVPCIFPAETLVKSLFFGLSTERNIFMRNFTVYITRHSCLTRILWSRARLPNSYNLIQTGNCIYEIWQKS